MVVNFIGSGAVSGGPVVRPLYGVFIRDQVAQLRANITVTLQDLKAGIKAGDPKAKPMLGGNGQLKGIEVGEAKKAANALNAALKDLKPVFGGGPTASVAAARATLSGGDGGPIRAMYGVFLASDLQKYRNEISSNMQTITDGIKAGTLSGAAATEGKKALKQLKSALTDIGGLSF